MSKESLQSLAGFLGELRVADRTVSVQAAEALLQIANGVDCIAELREAMATADGAPLPMSTCARLVGLLKGRARYSNGKWIESPFCLVETRKHPHRAGYQVLLSDQGKAMIQRHFSQHAA